MKTSRIIFFIFLAITSISCSTMFQATEADTININEKRIRQTPLITDLIIKNDKVEGKAIGSAASINSLKIFALDDAIKKSNADLLIGPQYSITTTNSKAVVTVTGRPANYKNFRKFAVKDTIVIDYLTLKASLETNNSSADNAQVEQKAKDEKAQMLRKKRIFGLTILILGTIVLIPLLL